jgi:hypothetical protein
VHGIGGLAGFQRFGRQRFTRGIDGAATDLLFLEMEMVVEVRGNRIEHGHSGRGDFGADAVAGQGDDMRSHAAFSVRCS